MDVTELEKDGLRQWLTDAQSALRTATDYISRRDKLMGQLHIAKLNLGKRKDSGTTAVVAIILIMMCGIPFTLLLMLLPHTPMYFIICAVVVAALIAAGIPVSKILRDALRPKEAKRVDDLTRILENAEREWDEYRQNNRAAFDAVRALPKVYRAPDAMTAMLSYIEKGWADNWEALVVLYEARKPTTAAEQTAEQFSIGLWLEQTWREEGA